MLASPPLPIRAVMATAVARLRDRARVVALAVLTFTLLTTTVSTLLGGRATEIEQSIAESASLTTAELQEAVVASTQLRTEQDVLNFLAVLSTTLSDPSAPITRETVAASYIARVGPLALLLVAVQLLLLSVAASFFLLSLSLPTEVPVVHQLLQVPLTYLRLIVLQCWMGIRAFGWIPLVGPFLALWYMPRMLQAFGIMIAGRQGILGSVQMSLQRSRGHWFAFFLRLLFLCVLGVLLLWTTLILAGFTAVLAPKAGTLIFLIGLYASTAVLAAVLLEI